MWYKLPSDNSTLNRSDAPPLPQHGFSLHDWHQQHFPTGLSWLSHEQWAAAILAVITHRHEDALLLPCAAARQCQSAACSAGTFIYLHPQVCNSTYSHSQYRNAFKSNRKMYIDDNRQITVPFAFFFFLHYHSSYSYFSTDGCLKHMLGRLFLIRKNAGMKMQMKACK